MSSSAAAAAGGKCDGGPVPRTPDKSSRDVIICWILEHACKHSMDDVISEICQMGPELCEAKFSKCDDVSFIFPALLYLRRWRQVNVAGTINQTAEYLYQAARILRNIYFQTDVMTLNFFLCIYARLAMLTVLCSMKHEDFEQTMFYLGDFFPFWSASFKKDVVKYYKIDNAYHLDKFRKTIGKCRRYVRVLLEDKSTRREYFEHYFEKDASLFLSAVAKLFTVFFDALSPSQLPRTVVDQLLCDSQLRSGQKLTTAHFGFVERLRQFGANPSPADLEELFLDVLSEMQLAHTRFLSERDVDVAADQVASLDTIITSNDFLFRCSADEATLYRTCRTSLTSDWTQSSSLGLSPQSRKRIGLEFESFVAGTLTPPRKQSRLPSCPDDAAAAAAAAASSVDRPSVCQSCVDQPSTVAVQTTDVRTVVADYRHLPPKKRAFAWPLVECVEPIPAKRQRRQVEISLQQSQMIKLYGETYQVYS